MGLRVWVVDRRCLRGHEALPRWVFQPSRRGRRAEVSRRRVAWTEVPRHPVATQCRRVERDRHQPPMRGLLRVRRARVSVGELNPRPPDLRKCWFLER